MASLHGALFFAILTTKLLTDATSSMDSELKALIKTGWWVENYSKNTSHHCKWPGITCNRAGSVTELTVEGNYSSPCCQLQDLNLLPFSNLARIHLTKHGFWGSISPQVGALIHLTYLNLSGNYLTGELPVWLANLTNLRVLDIARNRVYGEIPPEFGLGPHARTLSINLSHNNLSGRVPPSVSNLKTIDLSYNELRGPVPGQVQGKSPENSFHDNKNIPRRLQENFAPLPRLETKQIKHKNYAIVSLPIVLFFVTIIFGAYVFLSCVKPKQIIPTLDSKHGDIFQIWNYDGRIAYEQIVEATQDFDVRYCVGTGGYGSVYKAALPNGRAVALKKLHGLEGENPTLTHLLETRSGFCQK